MYTLPTKTGLRIRKRSKALESLVITVMSRTYGLITVELTDFVKRRTRQFDGRVYRWYDLVSGEVTTVLEPERQFEIEPGYALFEHDINELSIFLTSFARDLDQVAALDIARDAWLDGRVAVCHQIAREALRHGWPLFVTLLEKEKNRRTA